MRKFLILLMTLEFSIPAGDVSAQHRIGAVGGLSLSKIAVENADVDFGRRSGLGVGGIIDLALGEHVALRLEPMYLQKGVMLDAPVNPYGEVDGELRLSYLEFPVFIMTSISDAIVRLYVLFGPTFGFLLSSRVEGTAGDQAVDEDVGEVTSNLDVGLGFGGGVNFLLGDYSLFVEGRYVAGLKDILDDGRIEIAGEDEVVYGDVSTSVIQFMAGITIPIL